MKASNLSLNVSIPKSTHYYWMDLIRFGAAFLVVLCHYRGAFLPEYMALPTEQQTAVNFFLYAVTYLGHEAVLIFFVMSGFLVGGRAIEKIRNESFDINSYCIDRFVRIMLPLITALLLVIIKEIICGNEILWKEWFGCLFSLQGIWTTCSIDEPLWSLSYEVWFYILMGVYIVLFPKNRITQVLASLVCLVCFLVLEKLECCYLLIWIMGALAYVTRPKKANIWLVVITVFLLSIMVVVLQFTSGGHLNTSLISFLPTHNRSSLELIFAAIFCVLLQNVIYIKPKMKLTFTINRMGTKLAAFSYTLYLVHVLVMRVMQNFGIERAKFLDLRSLLSYFLCVIVGVIFCYLIYLCSERYTGTVKKIIKMKYNFSLRK